MQGEEQYLERTSDLVARVRKLREAAEKQMNRFTKPDDYDVRRVIGQKPKGDDQATSSRTRARPAQLVIDLSPAPAEPGITGGKE